MAAFLCRVNTVTALLPRVRAEDAFAEMMRVYRLALLSVFWET